MTKCKLFLLLTLLCYHYLFLSEALPLPVSDGFDFPVGKPNGDGYKVLGWDFLDWTTEDVYHPGEDWNGTGGDDTDLGQPVYAVSNGTVVASDSYKTWGNIILIKHLLPDGTFIWSQYAHLRDRLVKVDDEVVKGQKIGTIGKGENNRYPAHLHFEIRKADLRPYNWLPDVENKEVVLEKYCHPTNFIKSHGRLSPQWIHTSWDFNTKDDNECWSPGHVKKWVVDNGSFRIDIQDDPWIKSPPLSIDASKYNTIKVIMSSNAPDGKGAVYFITKEFPGWDEEKKVVFLVKNEPEKAPRAGWYDYTIFMGPHPKWHGTIIGVRIDPADKGKPGVDPSDEVGFDKIEFSKAALVITNIEPSAIQTKDWEESVTYTITVKDENGNPVSGVTISGEDHLRAMSYTTPSSTTNNSGQITYTTTVPNGKANGIYDITFIASKSGYPNSATVTRQVQVNHTLAQVGIAAVPGDQKPIEDSVAPTTPPSSITTPPTSPAGTANQGQLANTKIAFVSSRDSNPEIYLINADGINLTRLTNNRFIDNNPSWSPDGRKVAFVSYRDGNPEIYVMNSDGTNQIRLTNNVAEDSYPSWSPDGMKIAFYSARDGNGEIYIMNADGTNLVNLTKHPAWDSWPSWSPDGKKIAFVSNRNLQAGSEIYVMNVDETNQIQLTKTNKPAANEHLSWSPDGTKIAFWSNRDGGLGDIYLMNADGTNLVNLTNNPARDLSPSWSPDGAKIAFWSDRDGNPEIYIMNADGTNLVNLTNHIASDTDPSWSPFFPIAITVPSPTLTSMIFTPTSTPIHLTSGSSTIPPGVTVGTVSGGVPPYVFTEGAPDLAWLNVKSEGTIVLASGQVVPAAGNYILNVKVTDNALSTASVATGTVTIMVLLAPPKVTKFWISDITSNSVTFAWSSSDDVSAYEILVSTDSNLSNANKLSINLSQPQKSGVKEIGNLSPNTTYYFAIRVAGVASNWSDLFPPQPTQPISAKTHPECFFADIDCNGEVDIQDIIQLVANYWDTKIGDPKYEPKYDVNNDGEIDIIDVQIVANQLGKKAPFPFISAAPALARSSEREVFLHLRILQKHLRVGEKFQIDIVSDHPISIRGIQFRLAYSGKHLSPDQVIIKSFALLAQSQGPSIISLGPKSNNSEGILTYGQLLVEEMVSSTNSEMLATIECEPLSSGISSIQLKSINLIDAEGNLLSAIISESALIKISPQVPVISVLGQNYPNPFNPETRIPYHLAAGSEVIIDIYNIKGERIRRLDLGYKEAGFYIDKTSAAYWDGKNTAGEKVTSGLYFYCLRTDNNFSAIRKMVVEK